MKKLFLLLTVIIIMTGCTPQPTEEKVRNIIIMIGDGMGLTQISALSLTQDYAALNMERAKYIGIQKTYSANNRVTDSAASGTAIATGEKTNNGSVALDTQGRELESSLKLSQRLGKATGLVVTCPLTAATPAVFYAHTTLRRDHEQIAEQLLESGIDVLAGSARKYFTKRKDKRNLVEEFKEKGYTYAPDKKSFLDIESAPAILLTKDSKNMVYVSKDSLGIRGSYLAEATAKAIELLEGSGKDGFFLMVEGSLIDYAGHDNDIAGVIGEMRDFDDAVKVAFDYADRTPGTLVIVTGDHETGGLSIVSNDTDFTLEESGVDFRFSTESHSGTFLPLFAYGTGAENFIGVMENSDIGKKVKLLLSEGAKNRP